jgi:hypothetical protein
MLWRLGSSAHKVDSRNDFFLDKFLHFYFSLNAHETFPVWNICLTKTVKTNPYSYTADPHLDTSVISQVLAGVPERYYCFLLMKQV